MIDINKIYLCDSGAQFTDGTTECVRDRRTRQRRDESSPADLRLPDSVTRTLHFGTPTNMEKRAYTRVLQGHIAIDDAVFPSTTSGFMLDSWARRPLWKDGLGAFLLFCGAMTRRCPGEADLECRILVAPLRTDYGHGTGHGVGSWLNVHEGPMGIGSKIAYHDTKLEPNMVISNEPGYYQDGEFGIRIESLVVVRPQKTPHEFGGVKYYGMEHLTMVRHRSLGSERSVSATRPQKREADPRGRPSRPSAQCPIATNLVEPSLMSMDELEWLNRYNAEVRDKVGPLIREAGDEEALE